MFCNQCGTKLPDNSKFCYNCGCKIEISPILKDNYDVNVVDNNKVVSQDMSPVAKIFDKYFSKDFANTRQIYLATDRNFDTSRINELKKCIGNDVFLMLVTYYHENEGGVVITDKRIFIEDERKSQCLYLNEVKSAWGDKKGLADVLGIETMDGKIGGPIYLTGIREVQKFQLAFIRFIEEVAAYYHPELKKNNQESVGKPYIDIGKICEENYINSSYIEIGNPLTERNSKKLYKAMVNLDIRSNEEVYLIHDCTITGSCREAFALCTTGLYGCDENKKFIYIPWEKFKDISYKSGFMGLKIGKYVFNISPIDMKGVVRILDAIKKHLV